MDHLSSHKLLSDSQFGDRKNRSTVLQLLTVMEDWTEALDNNLQADTVYLDFREAFDSVPHKSYQEIRKVQNKWKLVEMVEKLF